MSGKKMKLESAEDDIQTVQVLCKSYVLVACLLCIYPKKVLVMCHFQCCLRTMVVRRLRRCQRLN